MLNYLVNRQLGKRKEAIAMFVNLKVPFDTVDKDVLDRAIKEKEIRKASSKGEGSIKRNKK